jgi:protein TonB
MNLERLKSQALEQWIRLRTVYWPRLLLWLESHSPRNLFLRALLIGLLISVPWQCSRLIYQHYFNGDTADSTVESTSLTSPEPSSGSITGMPRPGARRPVIAASETPLASAEPSAEPNPVEPEAPPSVKVDNNREASVSQRIAPEYPAGSIRKNETGTVMIRVEIDASGSVKKVQIAQGSGSRALDRAAREAVLNWQFTPKLVNGEAVESELLIPVDFKLDQ